MQRTRTFRSLVALFFAVLILPACGAPAAPPTPTLVPPTVTLLPPTATPTLAPTNTLTPSPTITLTPTPTNTPTSTPTDTPSPTATPLPTLTATATATRPPTATPTRVPPPPPTFTPTPAGPKYPAPVLISPNDRHAYTCSQSLTFKWSGPAALGEDEWYLIESAKPERPDQWVGIADWSKETTKTLEPARNGRACLPVWWCPLGGSTDGAYLWRVKIVRGDLATHTIKSEISPPSESRLITSNVPNTGSMVPANAPTCQ